MKLHPSHQNFGNEIEFLLRRVGGYCKKYYKINKDVIDYKNRCVMRGRVLHVIKTCVMEGWVVSPFTPPTMP